jgi:hypothetical protein
MKAVEKAFCYIKYFAELHIGSYISPSEFAAHIAERCGRRREEPEGSDFQTARRAIKVLAGAGLLEVKKEADKVKKEVDGYTGKKKPANPAKYRLDRAAVEKLLASPPNQSALAKQVSGPGVMLRRALGYIAWFAAHPDGVRARDFGVLLAHEADVEPEDFLDHGGLQKANRVIKTLHELEVLTTGGSRCRTCTRACSGAAGFKKADGMACGDRRTDYVWVFVPEALGMLIRVTQAPANANVLPARRAA